MRRLWILTLLAFLAAGQGPDRAAVQLQAAIKTEVFDGNLKGAIEQYEKIIDTYKSNRAVVAEALVRMAQCYEKLGDVQAREARSAYERVVREFADQAEPAARARARLAAIASAAGATADDSGGIRIQQIWTDPPRDIDPYGSPSPDGRSFAYMTDAGDLMIRDLTTGVDRRVTSLVKDTPGASADTPRWSPQGDVIVYAWYSARQPLPKEGEGFQVRLYDIKTDKTRILMSGNDPYPLAWSGDGKDILIYFRENGIGVLGLVSVDSGAIRPVKRFSSDQPSYYGGDLSPDGKFIAYAESPRQGELNYDLVVIDAATGQETCHIGHPAEELLLGWSRDGRYLLFQSNRTGTRDVWVQRVENGKSVSEPVLIKSSVGRLFPLGFSARGAFFYGTRNEGTDIYLSETDLSGGRMTKPQKLIADHEGSNSDCVFSPDGRYLAYMTFRGTVSPGPPGSGLPLRDTICVYSVETGRNRQYLAQMRISSISRTLEWSSDNRFVFFTATTSSPEGGSKTSLYKLDIQSGEIGALGNLTGHVTSDGKSVVAGFSDLADKTWHVVRRDLQTGVETELYKGVISYSGTRPSSWRYYVGSDEKVIFLHFQDDLKTLRLVRRDIKTGAETELYRDSTLGFSSPTLSPDHRFLAVWYSEKSAEGKSSYNLRLISTADGTREVLISLSGLPGSVYWSPDSHSLLVRGSRTSEGQNFLWDLWRVTVDGRPPTRIEPKIPNLRSLSIHPDGKRIAFTLGPPIGYQVWVMENYLPPLKESKK